MIQFISISILIIFVLWLNYEIRKNNRLSNKSTDEFLKKDSQANLIRKADISDLNYISIPFDKLPLEDNPDQTINSYRDTILSHSDKKILNLSGISNIELKNKYGLANLKLLSEYDNNYTVLVAILHKWGERLYQHGSPKEALAVLETALDCKTDVHKTYELLAELYIEQGTHNKIHLLLDNLSSTHTRDKEKLLQKLQDMQNS